MTYYVYRDPIDGQLISGHLALLLNQFFTGLLFHLCISWIGSLYVKTELLRGGNDSLLNNLKEGVFVIDEVKDKIRFVNEAGDTNLKKNYLNSSKGQSLTVDTTDRVIDKTQKQFALIDKQLLLVGTVKDSHEYSKRILAVDDYLSLDEIIKW